MMAFIKSVFFRTVVTLLLGVGYLGIVPLVAKHVREGSICPKIASIPACFIILACLVIATLAHFKLFPKHKMVYYISIGIPLLIAIYATIGNIAGFAECPVGEDGVPLCYYSLALFVSLFITKIVESSIKVP